MRDGFVMVVLLASASSCRGERPDAAAATFDPRVQTRAAPAIENSRGVVGGPRDESAFEYDVEPATAPDEPPILDGIPPIPEAMTTALAPYLQARRTRVASINHAGPVFVVLTRMAEVTQAYSVDAPLGQLRQLTQGRDPVAQASLIPGGGGQLLVRRDHDGNEQFQLYRYDTRTEKEELLSDGKSRHGSFSMNRIGGLAFSNNQRNPSDMDVYVGSVRKKSRARRIVQASERCIWRLGQDTRLEYLCAANVVEQVCNLEILIAQ